MHQGNMASIASKLAQAEQLVARGRKLLDNWDDEADINRARRLFQQATELAPDSAEAWRGLADAMVEDEEHEHALHAYQHAIEHGADGADLWRGVARAAYWFPDQLNLAVEAIERVRGLRPDDVELLNDYADVLTKAGMLADRPERLLQAIEALDHALSLQASDAWNGQLVRTLIGRGGLLIQLQQDAEALAAYEELWQRTEVQHDSWLKEAVIPIATRGRAIALYRLGRLEEAAAVLERGATDFPDQFENMRWQAFLADLLLAIGQADAALTAIEVAVSGDSWFSCAPIWRTYAQVLRAHGRFDEAQVAETSAQTFEEGPSLETLLMMNEF